jgi:hypothetical protein
MTLLIPFFSNNEFILIVFRSMKEISAESGICFRGEDKVGEWEMGFIV